MNELLERLVQERTAELRRAVEDLEAFTYTVSHDLRAPLRAIEGFSAILAEEHADELSPEGLRILGVVRDSVGRMSRLIDDLLHLTRLGRQGMRVSTVDLDELVDEVAGELSAADPEHGVRVAHERLGTLRADATLLRLAVLNLLDNAVKFTRGRAEGQVTVWRRDEGEQAVLGFTDNGVGFDQDYAGQMFETFQRLHPATEFPGTGVGLAIVKRVADRHGGTVFAESAGAGATVGLRLPVRLSEDEADAS